MSRASALLPVCCVQGQMGVQAVLAWGHSARVRLKLVKLETKSCRCVLVCACMSRDESSIVEAAITGFGLDWYWSGAVLLPWVGCLIGNQYVSLNSLLLIIVLFFTTLLNPRDHWFAAECIYWSFHSVGKFKGNGRLTVTSLCTLCPNPSPSAAACLMLFPVSSCRQG